MISRNNTFKQWMGRLAWSFMIVGAVLLYQWNKGEDTVGIRRLRLVGGLACLFAGMIGLHARFKMMQED